MTAPPFGSYTVVSFNQKGRTLKIEGLSVDAARHIAQTHAGLGEAARIHLESGAAGSIEQFNDYCESYCLHGSVRRGTFAQITLIATGADGGNHAICCEKAIADA